MSNIEEIKRGDTDPVVAATNGMPLAGCTWRLLACVAYPLGEKIELPSELHDEFSVIWTPDGTLEANTYNCELEVTTADGVIITFPKRGFVRFTVGPDIR